MEKYEMGFVKFVSKKLMKSGVKRSENYKLYQKTQCVAAIRKYYRELCVYKKGFATELWKN